MNDVEQAIDTLARSAVVHRLNSDERRNWLPSISDAFHEQIDERVSQILGQLRTPIRQNDAAIKLLKEHSG